MRLFKLRNGELVTIELLLEAINIEVRPGGFFFWKPKLRLIFKRFGRYTHQMTFSYKKAEDAFADLSDIYSTLNKLKKSSNPFDPFPYTVE